MTGEGALRWSADLSPLELALVGLVVLVGWSLLALELRKRGARRWAVASSGALGVAALGLAVARPVRVHEDGLARGARVVALVDRSERLLLPGDAGKSRRAVAGEVVAALREHFRQQRLEVWSFGRGELRPGDAVASPVVESDLSEALSLASRLPGERPASIVVVSDGRWTEPGPVPAERVAEYDEALARHLPGVPLHGVRLTERVPRDRAIRAVRTTGSAVAHQPFPLTIEAGCEPRTDCPALELVVHELLENAEPQELARGSVEFHDGLGLLELSVTVERAGSRVLSVTLQGTDGDEVPANDRRLVPLEVRRDRMRILHVAGRPTYDSRALRLFLKADESIDLVTFFILRTPGSHVDASDRELSLIPFPVDELFTEHLPSFDAIVLQDIDARVYGLSPYFAALREYVQKGGGLILVGGPGSFAAGGYADSPLAEVLPVELPSTRDAVVRKAFEPRYTPAGLVAPMLAGLRDLLGTRLPGMEGANRVGAARPGAFVLWEHPGQPVDDGARSSAMPILSLGEAGDGRAITLAVDGSHLLRFGELGARSAGRGHTALWEGLLGWLMRDSRYEAARVQGASRCFAGLPLELVVTPLPDMGDEISVTLERLGDSTPLPPELAAPHRQAGARSGRPLRVPLPGLPPGAYAARAAVGEAPAVRWVFVCEEGGGAFADSRPDVERLARGARATGGESVDAAHVDALPLPAAERVLTYSTSRPLLPDWAWATLSTVALALHFWLRRAGGYA